ncbi:hypothetical protein [Flavobacterium sedimenticola]|uniref:Uncharacterized protein n=1 Tax=Flavobacterium sedimenticola TaxID=3043286 RepID=A0ABT6XS89_9FLAO|nr:hypothetical protein [Flavobacterium sedimenticola]MDI9257968.1 hypothetical protein [Flavobacterium sedimenticola]
MKNILEIMKNKNEVLLMYGAICLLGALVCIIISRYSVLEVMGVNAWMKPIKFFISVTVFSWTMGWYLQYLENQRQVEIYSWSMVVLFSVEMVLIIYQAAQGKMSHFNQETAIDRTIFSLMALAITVLMLHTLYIAILFFKQSQFEAPETLILAVKLSLLVTVLFAFEGFVMGAALKHTIGSQDGSQGLPLVNWSTRHGDLRVAHFFGIHALQIIPLLSYWLARSKREVMVIAFVYFAFVSYTLWLALQGKPLIKL